MEIEDPDARTVATVKKALITPLRERMFVSVEGGPDLDVQGNILDHEYSIEASGDKVADVSKRWFRVADTAQAAHPRRRRDTRRPSGPAGQPSGEAERRPSRPVQRSGQRPVANLLHLDRPGSA
jgi:hypothetical protein